MSYLKNQYVTVWLKEPVVHDKVYKNEPPERKYYVMGRLIKSDLLAVVLKNNSMMGAHEEEIPRDNIVLIQRSLTEKEIQKEEDMEEYHTDGFIKFYSKRIGRLINDIMWNLEYLKRKLINLKNTLVKSDKK